MFSIKRNKIMRIAVILASIMAIIGLGGCSANENVLCGGVTDRTDPNAPKVIRSKDIATYSAHFFLQGEWTPGHQQGCAYTFTIRPDDKGVLMVTESELKLSAPADKELLQKLQRIIDDEKLAKENGYYRVTAGLPPEFQPCHFNVNYASGEKLTFTKNNDPDAKWAEKTYMVFAQWFAKHGNESLLPPRVTREINHISIDFKDNDTFYSYSPMYRNFEDADNNRNLQFNKMIVQGKNKTTNEFIEFPPDFYDNVNRIVSKYDLHPFDSASVLYSTEQTEADQKDAFSSTVQINIQYKDGYNLPIHTSAEKSVNDLRPLIKELIEYFDTLF